MCRPPPVKGRRRPWHWLIYLCVCVGILPAGSGGEQAEEVKCLPINFFLLDAPEFTAIKINLCESGLSLQDLVTFACLHIKFNNPVCESNHSLNNRFNLGCHLSGFGQERPNCAAGLQLFRGRLLGWLKGSLLCSKGVFQSKS